MNEKIILLIEDNPSDEALTLRALRKNNISDTEVKRDGAEALDYLHAPRGGPGSTFAPLPQLVLLDLNLPKIDGLEVLRRIRADARTKLRDPDIVARRHRYCQRIRLRYQRLCPQAG
jgi:two-component system response regulator